MHSSRDHFRLHYIDLSAPTPREVGSVLHALRGKLMVGGVLLGSAIALTAFGLAPHGNEPTPDSAIASVSTVTASEALSSSAADLEPSALPLVADTQTRRGETVRSLLQRLDVEDAAAETYLREHAEVRRLLNDEPGARVKAHINAQGELTGLRFTWLDARKAQEASQFALSLHADGQWQETTSQVALTPHTRLVSGTIQSSLFAATDAQNIPDSIAVSVAEIFANDIDFRRDLRKNDRFTIAYEEWGVEGEMMRTGRVLGAEFVNKGRALQAIWFEAKGDYFDGKGQSSKRQFLSSPMKFSRVTSGFAMRFHPIQKTWKRHLGVDYGAPTGTPVRSIGSGRVVFAGQQRGYGNVVEIQHDGQNRTLYAHLSRIFVRKGQSVEREQDIGAVGSTGWATGPHLHFELRVNGVHQDPLLLAKRSKALTLSKSELAQFKPIAKDMLAALSAGGSTQTASAR